MFFLALISTFLYVASASYEEHYHPKDVLVKEKTVGKAYSDVKVNLENDKFSYKLVEKSDEGHGKGSERYQYVSAITKPEHKHYHYEVPHKKEHVLEEPLYHGYVHKHHGYGPEPHGYGPKHHGYGPEPHGYGPEPLGYGPEPLGYGPEHHGYGPEPHGYGPEPLGYGPEPLGYGPEHHGYGPEPHGYGPEPLGYGHHDHSHELNDYYGYGPEHHGYGPKVLGYPYGPNLL